MYKSCIQGNAMNYLNTLSKADREKKINDVFQYWATKRKPVLANYYYELKWGRPVLNTVHKAIDTVPVSSSIEIVDNSICVSQYKITVDSSCKIVQLSDNEYSIIPSEIKLPPFIKFELERAMSIKSTKHRRASLWKMYKQLCRNRSMIPEVQYPKGDSDTYVNLIYKIYT